MHTPLKTKLDTQSTQRLLHDCTSSTYTAPMPSAAVSTSGTSVPGHPERDCSDIYWNSIVLGTQCKHDVASGREGSYNATGTLPRSTASAVLHCIACPSVRTMVQTWAFHWHGVHAQILHRYNTQKTRIKISALLCIKVTGLQFNSICGNSHLQGVHWHASKDKSVHY
jgi:hypothetical protein